MKEYELVVTYKCNWKCKYCAVDTHNQDDLDLEDVFKKIEKIEDGSNVTLSGGELGMKKKKYLLPIIEALENKNCNLALNTNGLFIRTHPDLIKRFEYILYHCSENLTTIDHLPDSFDSSFTQYMIVVDDTNFKNLDSFLSRYPDIVFDIVPATLPEGIKGTTLSYKNRVMIFTRYTSRMTEESKHYLMKGRPYDIEYL